MVKRLCCARSKFVILARLRMEQIVISKELVTELEVPNRVKCPEGSELGGGEAHRLTLRWNT